MKKFKRYFTYLNSRTKAVLTSGLLLLLFSLPVLAASGGSYDLFWDTLDGGGNTSSGGNYTISGTAGQPDASSAMTGGNYSVSGGFWVEGSSLGPPDPDPTIHIPIVFKN